MASTDLTSVNRTLNATDGYRCRADGTTTCNYYKKGVKQFELLCECGLNGLNVTEYADHGYCPMPGEDMIENYIYWSRRMWLGDNCHTLDRHVYQAQRECGIGLNQNVLNNSVTNGFKIKYYPYIQAGNNSECI